MGPFYVAAAALPDLSLLLLAALIAGTFALLPEKAPGTGWVVALMSGLAAGHAVNVLAAGADGPWAVHINALLLVCPLASLWAMLGFAYRFLGDPYPRESRLVLTGTGLAAAGQAAGHLVWGMLPPGALLNPLRQGLLVTPPFLLALVLWTVVVMLRRAGRAPDASPGGASAARGRGAFAARLVHPPTAESRAFRALLLIETCAVVALAALVLRDAGVIGPLAWRQVTLFATTTFLLGFVTVYANAVPFPTTLQVKVVGFALAVGLSALGMGAVVALPTPAWRGAPPPQAVGFRPDGAGGYRLAPAPGALDPSIGAPLALHDGVGVRVGLGFAFPFAGRRWREAYVDDDGFVSFGSTFQLTSLAAAYGIRTPWVGPLVADLQPGDASVYVRREPGRATVTWREVPVYGRTTRATAQLVLEESGSVVFRYGSVPPELMRLRGLHVGPRTPVEYGALGVAPRAVPAAGLVEDRYRVALRAEHRRAAPLAALMLVFALVVLVAFPLYLRASITRPLGRLLGGVRRVNDGDLGSEVTVGVRDEIGRLTAEFNQMTGSLRRYATQMEGLVAERTVALEEKSEALEQSLDGLRGAQARLVQQEKLASLGGLAAGLAHEIKNPLNFVTNFAQLNVGLAADLREAFHTGDREMVEEMLVDLEANTQKIHEHGHRADGIVRGMLGHARGEGGQRQPFGLNALVEEHVALVYHGARARDGQFQCTVEIDLDPAVGDVDGVPQEIARVLQNLLGNAFDAVRARATAGGDGAPFEPVVTVRTRRTGDSVTVAVGDNGPGVPADLRARIFEPFFTTKPTGQGTGLGLSLSHGVVVGHGGALEVESVEGAGATFTVTLPSRNEPDRPTGGHGSTGTNEAG